MTSSQRNQLAKRLKQLQTALSTKGPPLIEPNRRNEAGEVVDDDEQALNEMLQSIASNRNRNDTVVLTRIARAQAKIKSSPADYGVCEECGEDIGLGRLKVLPYAELCVTCQGKQDAPRGGPTRKHLTDYR